MTKTVLITGADGNIGSHLRELLAGKYTLKLLTMEPLKDEESTIGDIADLEAIAPAFKGVDSVVHLAANPSVQAPWDSVLHDNIIGTYNVFEAAHQAGVKQVIFASSNHAVGTYEQQFEPGPQRPRDKEIDHLVMLRPDSLYGVSKCFGEALGAYYADHKDMRVICLRIGWITPDDQPKGQPDSTEVAMWQSQRDFAQMVEQGLEADHVKFDIFYGISNNPYQFFDLDHAKEQLGYQPQDSSSEKLR